MRFILICILSINTLLSFANNPFKFGKVSMDELKQSDCSFLENSAAMVTGEVGELGFVWIPGKGYQYELKVTVRKKIFTNSGKDQGNIKVKLYQPVNEANSQTLEELKGFTYNLVNGKVQKTKLTESDKFETRLNDYWVEINFAMPAIQNGSVIEYKYTINSSYVSNLKTWFFQSDIPVKYSEFSYYIPEFLTYKSMVMGSSIPLESEDLSKHQTFTIESRDRVSAGLSEKTVSDFETRSIGKKIIAKNVLPVEHEPYMSNKVDVPCRIEFQLDYIQFKGQPIETVAGTYEEFNAELLKDESFGLRLNNSFFAKDWTESVAGKDDIAKAISIFRKAQNHFIFDGVYGIFSDKAGRNAYTSKEGSVADINLSLVAAFKDAGLEVYPVILSTKSNGTPHPLYPSFDDFNYVVAAVIIDNKIIFADAASNMPFGKLPYKCLNGNGWLVAEQGRFVSLKKNNPNKTTRMIMTELSDGKLVSSYSVKEEDYAAITTINSVQKDKTQFEDDLKSVFTEGTLGEVTYHEDNSKDVFKYEFTVDRPFDETDIIYFLRYRKSP